MKITALLDALNSVLAEPFVLSWSRDSPRFLLVFTVVYAVVVIVVVTDQKNTRPGAEHGSAVWGDVLRLNKFYMDKRGPNLLLTQHFHIGIDGYKHMIWKKPSRPCRPPTRQRRTARQPGRRKKRTPAASGMPCSAN